MALEVLAPTTNFKRSISARRIESEEEHSADKRFLSVVVRDSSSDDNVEPICPGKVLNSIIHKYGNLNLMVNSMEKKMVTLIIPATLAIMKLIAYQLSTSGI